jgi:hypothetical protein
MAQFEIAYHEVTKSREGNAHKLRTFVILRALLWFMLFSFIVKPRHYP